MLPCGDSPLGCPPSEAQLFLVVYFEANVLLLLRHPEAPRFLQRARDLSWHNPDKQEILRYA
jgi:hypothetical protein